MKKSSIITALGASVIGASAASYFLMNDEQKTRIKERLASLKTTTLEKAGKPDQVPAIDETEIENAKMVSEGSQFGVQYYTEKREEE